MTMQKLLNQSLKPKKINFWKLGLAIIGIIFLMRILMRIILTIAIQSGALIGNLVAILVLISGSLFSFVFIYKHLSLFNYKLIDNELILERSLGRANHVIYVITKDNFISLSEYQNWDNNKKIPWLNHLTVNSDKSKWYVVSFNQNNKQTNLVIEPNEEFLEGLVSFSKE